MEFVRLRPDTIAEPLIDRWYAWLGLIPPATRSLYLAEKYLKMMESFVRAPLVHVNSLRNPAMAGGPYIDLPAGQSARVRELLEETTKTRQQELRLARDLKALAQLVATASGGPMEQLYPSVPDSLRGCVELVYDLENRPSFRLFEEMFYAAYPFERSRTSWMLKRGEPDGRSFAMNTPRLDEPGRLHVELPFDDPAVDWLFSAGVRPIGEFADVLGIPLDSELFRSMVTTDPQPATTHPPAEGLRWRYFGHASVLFETAEVAVMTDPAVSTQAQPSAPLRFTIDDLPSRIDYVLITHNHWDHIQLESLLRLRGRIGTVVAPRNRGGVLQDPSLALAFRAVGFKDVREINVMETLQIPGGSITALPFLGEHADLDIGAKIGYAIELRGRRFALVADAANLEPAVYEQVSRLVGPIGTLFVGMECEGAPMSWLYGPLLFKPMNREQDRARRLAGSNATQAASMAAALRCSEVYIYALGREAWMNHLMQVGGSDGAVDAQIETFIGLCSQRGIRAEVLSGIREQVIKEGE